MTTRNRTTTKTASEVARETQEKEMLERKDLNTVGGHDYKPFDSATQDPGVGGTAADVKGFHDKEVNRTQDATQEKPEGLPVKEAHLEQVKQARAAEAKSLMAVVASERMLPMAPAYIIERNAADLLHLPMTALRNIVARQERMAADLEEAAKKASCETDENGKQAGGEPGVNPFAPKEEETKEAGAIDPKDEKIAALEAKLAAFEAPTKEEDALDVKNASAGNLLDSLFSPRSAAQPRVGAAFGKQASAAQSEEDALASMWRTSPDVGSVFR